jgi:hypothetical protein
MMDRSLFYNRESSSRMAFCPENMPSRIVVEYAPDSIYRMIRFLQSSKV